MILMKYIDADNLILGRMAAVVAKDLLDGETITIVNIENAVISGTSDATLKKYYERTKKRSITNPRLIGPFHPKDPVRIARRTVRGMIPYKKPKGKEAYGRLKVWIGVPEELGEIKTESIPEASAKDLGTRRFIKLGRLSKRLGVEV